MPNYSSSSVNVVDWAMGFDGSRIVKQRNLLENLPASTNNNSSTPAPPSFQDFIALLNTKKRTHTSLSTSSNSSSDNSFYLPHQTPSPLLDHTNYKYAKIRARPLYNFKYNEASIWTQSSANSTNSLLSNLSFDVNVVNKFFAKETKENKLINNHEQHSRNSSNVTTMTRPFQLLDKSLQITYDVAMRHLLQLLAKNNNKNKNATIDDVLHGIDTGNINSEWLQCVQRLNKTLNKQFDKRPEDKLKFETFNIKNLDDLNLVEQFFIKLLRIPNYSFKLKCYQYRDELQPQLVLFSQSIEHFIRGIELVLGHEHLPGIFQLLCFLYNSVSNKSVPGLDLVSLVDALNSPTNQSNKTVAHVLVEILDKYYRNSLMSTINDEKFTELKKVCSINFSKIYVEIRDIYQQYQQLDCEYSFIKNHYELPLFIQSMFVETKLQFEKLFKQENILKKGEQDLAAYFCSNDLSINVCLSTVGQFIDKLRLAHVENNKEQKRKLAIKEYDRKRSGSLPINTTASILSCI
ncbi:unnamed protein product [Adineta steineri]|uniref:FH2 domain-containing protein n=1 Tax=Adineta steineri TaxID=433720 RepID=A0A814ABI1_9BILA|nr:unnamed protein product [Adineta steineri]CAF0840893.1 unnamed protein product [Adineta steineri]CAF0910348.1 unnamed protein product [Adineta steineri]